MKRALKSVPTRPVKRTATRSIAPTPQLYWKIPVAQWFGLWLPLMGLGVSLWALRDWTVDDAYISFRYARNFARGLGLVYQSGVRVEGYTNFLWTAWIGGVMKLGIDPLRFTKFAGMAGALLGFYSVYQLARLLSPRREPVVATWLFASSATLACHSLGGLETGMFSGLMAFSLLRLWREEADARAFPWSGVCFGALALLRPEGIVCAGILMLTLSRAAWRSERQRWRLALVILPWLAHLIWRRAYYGTWVPNTFFAKTGNLQRQWNGGTDYIYDYLRGLGFVVLAAGYGVWDLARRNRRALVALVGIPAFWLLYICMLGADWMPQFRYFAYLEPFLFVLIDCGCVWLWRERTRVWVPLIAALSLWVGVGRVQNFLHDREFLLRNNQQWREAEGAISNWLLSEGAGEVAVSDIGEIGYRTDYPVLDLLGLVEPRISKLEGGYAEKFGPAYKAVFYQDQPRYFVSISASERCESASLSLLRTLVEDPRFEVSYRLLHSTVVFGGPARWCLFERSVLPNRVREHAVFDWSKNALEGWKGSRDFVTLGYTATRNPVQQPLAGNSGPVLNSYAPERGDAATGRLESPPFVIDRRFIGLRVGGGDSPLTRVELWVDGELVQSASGSRSEYLRLYQWDLAKWRGHRAHLTFIDETTEAWGHLLLSDIALFDVD